MSVLPHAAESVTASICQGESYLLNGISYSAAGTFVDTLTAANGCDSIITLTLTVLPNATESVTASICQGESFLFNGNSYSTAGTFVDTLMAMNSCDSIVTLTLSVLPNAADTVTASICQGETFLFNGNSYSTAGTFTDTLSAANGCDSLLTLELTVLPAFANSESASICQGDSYLFNGISYSLAGTYVDTIRTPNGCLVTTLTLSVLQATFGTDTVVICEGDTYQFNGEVYQLPGWYTDTLTNQQGCDSILHFLLNLAPLPSIDSVSIQGPACGETTGTITIYAQVPGGGLLYSVDNGLTFSQQPVFGGLATGSYTILVKHATAPFCTSPFPGNPVIIAPATNCCPSILVLDDTPILPGAYLSSDRIFSAGHVATGTEVIFGAGTAIELLPGFTVESGGIFEIKLEGCQQ